MQNVFELFKEIDKIFQEVEKRFKNEDIYRTFWINFGEDRM